MSPYTLRLRKMILCGACAGALATALAGCSGGGAAGNAVSSGNHASHMDSENHVRPNGDLQQKTGSVDTLPAFLQKADSVIVKAYQAAAANQDVLAQVPCYCGCGSSAGHASNLQCFIHETGEDGSVVWDDHGSRCGICMEIAMQAAVMKQEGKSVKEIRDAIDAKYKDSGLTPTKTPMPQV